MWRGLGGCQGGLWGSGSSSSSPRGSAQVWELPQTSFVGLQVVRIVTKSLGAAMDGIWGSTPASSQLSWFVEPASRVQGVPGRARPRFDGVRGPEVLLLLSWRGLQNY